MFLADAVTVVVYALLRLMPEWMFAGVLVLCGLGVFAGARAESPWPARLGGIVLVLLGIGWYLMARYLKAG